MYIFVYYILVGVERLIEPGGMSQEKWIEPGGMSQEKMD